jgi:8-amino-7-oxononanoate synthase
MSGFDQLENELIAKKDKHLYRNRRELQSAQSTHIRLDGKSLLAFCSNDYLGLANHPKVAEAFKRAVDVAGVGGGASHLVNGHHQYHHELELALAEFTGRPRALLFSTGYMANLGVVSALLGKGDAVFEDRLNHASLLDAGLLSGARFQRYLHNDLTNLEMRLNKTKAERKLVVTDGVFSMDGDLAPLPEIAALCQTHQAWLMVDDAHGFGTLGAQGGGIQAHFDLGLRDIQILVGTLGKAFGTAGAFVAGSDALIETLIQRSRTYIYTTSMPPAVAAATLASLEIVRQEPERRQHLDQLIRRFRAEAAAMGWRLMDSNTAIQPILLGGAQTALQLSGFLEDRGLLVTAIRPPTVPEGTSRLRITLSAAHTDEDLNRLLDALQEASGSLKDVVPISEQN